MQNRGIKGYGFPARGFLHATIQTTEGARLNKRARTEDRAELALAVMLGAAAASAMRRKQKPIVSPSPDCRRWPGACRRREGNGPKKLAGVQRCLAGWQDLSMSQTGLSDLGDKKR